MHAVEEARRIAPLLAAEAPTCDEMGRLTDTSWNAMLDTGLLRSLQPRRWGGGEVHLLEFLRQSVELSRAAGSAGWVAGVIGVHPWQLALFPEEAQDEMWALDASRMHSSSYNPTGRAERVPSGYRVSGRWSFSTGCDHCVGVNLGAVAGLRDPGVGKELPDMRSFLLYRDQYRIEDTWHVTGMRGTGSKDVVVDDAFVPEHRSQSHLDYALNLPLPGRERNDGPLYRLPWSVMFNMALASSIFGAAKGYLDTWIAENRDRKLAPGRWARDDALTQERLAEAVWTVDAAIAHMESDARELWEMAEQHRYATPEERGRYRWTLNHGARLVGEAVTRLHHAASGRAIFHDHPLHRRFHDVIGGLGHAYLVPDPLARSVGGTLLGTTNPESIS